MERAGVILAAGLGTRLRKRSGPRGLKPIANVGDVSLVIRTVNSLERAGCDPIAIVLGYHAEALRDFISASYTGPATLRFAVNERFHLKNGLSVLCARELVGERFVLTMADHVLGDELMDLAREHIPPADGATLLVDYKLDAIFDMDDATKVWADDGRVVHIGKRLERFNCVDTGVFVCTSGLMDAIDAVFQREGDASLSDGVSALAARGRMRALDIGDGFWQDVDTPEMLAHAEARLRERVKARKAG